MTASRVGEAASDQDERHAMSAAVAQAPAGIDRLRAAVRGTVALPGEAGYELSSSWNLTVQLRPRAVVAAADSEDVVQTVRFAVAHGYRVAVQCTGHGAVSMGGDDLLLIHTGQLDELAIDPETRRARVGAGLSWRSVLDAAARHGLAPNVGSAVDVGVVGFLTGAGIGPLVRTFGVGSDWVTAFDVVTGGGERLHATADHHEELFWGLRGGKGTLGVVCAVEIELTECAEIYGGAMYYDGEDAERVLRRWGRWTRDLPEHANTSIALLNLPALPAVAPALAGRMTVAVRFASAASASVCEPLLTQMREVAAPIMDTVAARLYTEIGAVHADPTEPEKVGQATTLLHELPDAAIDALLAVAGPHTGSPQTLTELRLLGGAYGRPAQHPSAFCHRGAAYSLFVCGRPADASGRRLAEHADEVIATVKPWSTGGMLPNFAAAGDPRTTPHRYDAATLVALSTIADRYDPAGVLWAGQVIRGF
jgi:hypothetical protein